MDYTFNITRTRPHKSQVTFLKRSPFTSLSWIPAGQTCEGTAASLLSWVGVGVRWGGGDGRGWFRRWTGREKIWKSAGSPEVKISEPVPEGWGCEGYSFIWFCWLHLRENEFYLIQRDTLWCFFFSVFYCTEWNSRPQYIQQIRLRRWSTITHFPLFISDNRFFKESIQPMLPPPWTLWSCISASRQVR